jgi:hypothetical protein
MRIRSEVEPHSKIKMWWVQSASTVGVSSQDDATAEAPTQPENESLLSSEYDDSGLEYIRNDVDDNVPF